MNAYLNDPGVKSELLESVRGRWEAKKLTPLPMLRADAERDLYSLGGALAESTEPSAFEQRTGIPVSLDLMCELLIMAGIELRAEGTTILMDGSPQILSFGIEWLDAIRPGADLSGVMPRFMATVLRTVLSPEFELHAHLSADTRRIGGQILAFWEREPEHGSISAQEWRAVREAAVRNSEDRTDPWEHTIAATMEALAWPLSSLPDEFVSIYHPLLTHRTAFLQQPFRDDAERNDYVNGIVGWRRLSEPDAEGRPIDEVLADRPDLLRAVQTPGEPEARERLRLAQQRARSATDPLLRKQMDLILDLIREI